jgi:hypothetical protein
MCSLSSEGEQHTIWKYNAPMHILLDHEQRDPEDTDIYMLPDVPVSMQAKIHISRAEESALGIKEQFTMQARADFNLPNSDDLPLGASEDCLKPFGTYDEIEEFIGKRRRSETQSSSKPPYKKHHS